MSKWDRPQEVTDLDIAFGGGILRLNTLLPQLEEIPEEYHRWNHSKWNHLFNQWFFKGIAKGGFVVKDGIDGDKAIRHLQAVMGSFEPSHERKEAGCSYLMSLWFDDYVYPEK